MPGRPKGSGYFALIFGVLFVGVLYASFAFDLRKLDPYTLFQAWLGFAAATLITWGGFRVMVGDKGWQVGQATINFVVGIIGAAIAILQLMQKP